MRLAPALVTVLLGLLSPAAAATNEQQPSQAVARNGSADAALLGSLSQQAKAEFVAEQNQRVGPNSEWQADFVKRSWEWHLLSTKIIFGVVIAIVAFGMFIAWLQFTREEKLYGRRKRAGNEEEQEGTYDISASMRGFSVKSKTIGAIVLVFSASFFLMYLLEVYPIKVVSE